MTRQQCERIRKAKPRSVQVALEYVGGLSATGKMPCFSWGLHPKFCQTGAKLRQFKNSVCARCYGFRGNYLFEHNQEMLTRRWESLRNITQWMLCMSQVHKWLYRDLEERYFRWFDNGDVQSVAHLKMIYKIARENKGMKYWIPTKERAIIQEVGPPPPNMVVRLGAPLLDQRIDRDVWRWGCSVHTKKGDSGESDLGVVCRAHDQGNQCLDCRKCWDRRVRNVSYPVW